MMQMKGKSKKELVAAWRRCQNNLAKAKRCVTDLERELARLNQLKKKEQNCQSCRQKASKAPNKSSVEGKVYCSFRKKFYSVVHRCSEWIGV